MQIPTVDFAQFESDILDKKKRDKRSELRSAAKITRDGLVCRQTHPDSYHAPSILFDNILLRIHVPYRYSFSIYTASLCTYSKISKDFHSSCVRATTYSRTNDPATRNYSTIIGWNTIAGLPQLKQIEEWT